MCSMTSVKMIKSALFFGMLKFSIFPVEKDIFLFRFNFLAFLLATFMFSLDMSIPAIFLIEMLPFSPHPNTDSLLKSQEFLLLKSF